MRHHSCHFSLASPQYQHDGVIMSGSISSLKRVVAPDTSSTCRVLQVSLTKCVVLKMVFPNGALWMYPPADCLFQMVCFGMSKEVRIASKESPYSTKHCRRCRCQDDPESGRLKRNPTHDLLLAASSSSSGNSSAPKPTEGPHANKAYAHRSWSHP